MVLQKLYYFSTPIRYPILQTRLQDAVYMCLFHVIREHKGFPNHMVHRIMQGFFCKFGQEHPQKDQSEP
jgi:hypothetical protein